MATEVEVRSSPGLLEPGVVGVFRLFLLLPEGIADRLTPPQLEAVLAHELCHVRRRDNLFASMHMIVEAMFWFHPLVWWIGARLVEERERACDEAVLSLGSEPRDYAEGILNVCKLYVESPLTCVSGVTGSDIRKRIEAIMTNRIALRLSFGKKLALAAAGMAALMVPIVVGTLHGQPVVAPKWEAAAIRPCEIPPSGGTKSGREAPSPGRLNQCATVMNLIRTAYVTFANGQRNPPGRLPISGGPAWINSERFQINAKAEGTPSREMMQGPMLQALLEDRFKLKIHRETREVPVYALTVAKGGPKLHAFKEGSCLAQTVPPTPPEPGQRLCGGPKIGGKGTTPTTAILEYNGVSLDELKALGEFLGRPVINKTGIAGLFDFHLEFVLDESTPGVRLSFPASDDDPGPSIFTAIQEQLGLKLDSAKGPGEFLVIDSVERPSEN